jgi:hypothetical protein
MAGDEGWECLPDMKKTQSRHWKFPGNVGNQTCTTLGMDSTREPRDCEPAKHEPTNPFDDPKVRRRMGAAPPPNFT